MRQTAVLIMGPMRAGKTTTASYLFEKRGFSKYSLATKLKTLYTEATGSLDKDREWLQNVGRGIRAVFGPDIWADSLIKQLEEEKPLNFVVDDVRYENELRILKDYAEQNYRETILIYIDCPQEVTVSRGAEIQSLSHESEQFAYLLHNHIQDSPQGLFIRYSGMEITVIDGSLPLSVFYTAINELPEFKNPLIRVTYDMSGAVEVIDYLPDEGEIWSL